MNNSVYVVYQEIVVDLPEPISILPDFPNLNPSGMEFILPFPKPPKRNVQFKIIAVCSSFEKANNHLLKGNGIKLIGPFMIEN